MTVTVAAKVNDELEFQSRQARYQCSSFDREFVRDRLLSYLDDIEREMGNLEQE